jgi:tetratricopeptide (TPR) repeat protein
VALDEVVVIHKSIALILLIVAACSLARTAHAAPTERQLADAISDLSDPDAAVRERASKLLWSAGATAEAALRQAAGSDDPEVARRARELLSKIQLGLLPDAPQEIFDLLDQYRSAPPIGRQAAINRLANQGTRGLRVLLHLRKRERDPLLRQQLLRAIGIRPHDGAAALLAEGDTQAAAELLEAASTESEQGARDWAAFLLLRGSLDAQIATLKSSLQNNVDSAATSRLVIFARARGDLVTARWAAEKSADPNLLDSILIEQNEWKLLAGRYRERAGNSAEALGFAATFARLSGDAEAVERAAAALRSHSDHHEHEYRYCAEALLLNDRPDEGVAVLLGHKDYALATDLLLPRLRIKEAIALADEERRTLKDADLLQARARSLAVYHFTGDRAAARKALLEISAANEKAKDFSTWLLLGESARRMDEPEEADRCFAAALALPSPEPKVAQVMESAGFSDDFPAAWWWTFLRPRHLTESYAQTLGRLRAFEKGALSAQEVEKLADEARAATMKLDSQADRDLGLNTIGETLELMGRKEAAGRAFRALADLSHTAESYQRAGDSEASRGDFASAAATYSQAWDLDRTNAAPLALHGWALLKAGDAKEGRACIDLAHLLPLANGSQRTLLEFIFSRHDLPDDARRERELIRCTGVILSWEVNNASRLSGDDANGRGDYLAAADFWEHAFLGNLKPGMSFNDPWSNVMIPTLIHKTRARGLAKTDPAGAAREARTAMADSPGDANALIEMVEAFEKSGHKAEADDLYGPTAAYFQRLCDDYPDSGPAHNQLAWIEAKCRRNLDDALKHARRTAELEPKNAAGIDTLAEVHFQRGEFDQAIVEMNKCVALEPADEQHRRQIARFEAAKAQAGGKRS